MALIKDANLHGSSRQERVEKAIKLLQDALALIDQNGLPAHIGARLQEVLEALRDQRT